jgi:tRNA pseudouridine38-40 synthase
MKRIMLITAYDGTNYCGWQIQPNGITVEEVLNRHLTALLKEPIAVIGASRTDSGVHALGNVAVFDSNTHIPGEKISYALNQRLPKDIVIQESKEVPLDFHPRFCNSIKTYQYRILNSRFPVPTCRLYTHFVYYPLDVAKMKEATVHIVGKQDFKSFCSTRTQVTDTVREVYSLDVKNQDDIITITVSGNGFLYNMVRIIVGTLIKVGLGVYPPEHVQDILAAKDRTVAGPKAPAQGLTLVGIEYPDINKTKVLEDIY